MTLFRRVIVLVAALGALGCKDTPTGARSDRERSGTIHVGENRAALVIEVNPATALDSLLIGPPSGGRGALIVHGPISARYLVLADSLLAPNVRFRAFINPAFDPASITLRVVETAQPDGSIDSGQNSFISFTH